MPEHAASGPVIPPLYYLAIGIVVVGRFLFRELRERKLKLSRIFFLPGFFAIFAAIIIGTTAGQFPSTAVLLAGEACITLGIGLAVGLAVAHFTTVRLGETDDTVYVLGSAKTVAIWIAALAARFAARFFMSHDSRIDQLAANAALVVMIGAALAMLRYRIVIDARELRAKGITTPVPVV